MKKVLTKSNNKVIAGVCGGLADYFDIDATVVRLLTAVFFIFSGFFPVGLAYIIAYFIMPEHFSHENHHTQQN